MIVYISLCLASGLASMLFYLYFWRQGQFDDIEDVKYQLFREDKDQNKKR